MCVCVCVCVGGGGGGKKKGTIMTHIQYTQEYLRLTCSHKISDSAIVRSRNLNWKTLYCSCYTINLWLNMYYDNS